MQPDLGSSIVSDGSSGLVRDITNATIRRGKTTVAAGAMILGTIMVLIGVALWRRARSNIQVATRGQKLARDESFADHSTKRIPVARSAADDTGVDMYELNDAAKAAAALEDGCPSPRLEGMSSPNTLEKAYDMDD